MPFVPGTVDPTGGDTPASQSISASQGGGSAGGSLPEAYQLMAAAMMHKMGRFPESQKLPGSNNAAVAKATALSRKAAKR